MIHIITASNRHLYRAELAEMHRLRKTYFVGERGWKDLQVVNGGEYDQFDDERTVYFLAFDADGQIAAGMRARPTDDKCMLTDLFPDLIGPDQGPMSGPDVWEISRIFATPAARAVKKATGRGVTLDIVLAAMEFTCDAHISRLVGIVDLSSFAGSRSKGWNMRMVGLPLDTPDGPIVGIESANTWADIDSFRRMNGRVGRAGRVATDADFAAFGNIQRIEAEFAILREDAEANTQASSEARREA